MPLPSEHAARQHDPGGFEQLYRRQLEGFPAGISAIFGVRHDGSRAIQSLRADREAFTPSEFRRWLEQSGYKTEIEEARSMADNDIVDDEHEICAEDDQEDGPDQEDGLDLAEWTSKYINDLPDSAFLFISPGGEKDESGRTRPRALRHLPYRNDDGKIDLPHLRSAISQMPKTKAPGLTKEKMRALQEKARKMLRGENEEKMAEPEEDEKPKDKPKGDDPFGGKGAPLFQADGFWGAPRHVALDSSSSRSWVEVVRSGTFYGSTGPKPRRVTLTPDDIGQMERSFATVLGEGWFNGGAPVGVNHASAFGSRDAESTKALARIEEVEQRHNADGSVSLWGLFSWTDEGVRRIGAREFSSVSAELIPPASSTSKLTGEPMSSWTLVGATLTNSPMIPGMQEPRVGVTVAATDAHPHRVALSERRTNLQRENQMSDNLLLKLAEATGLPSEHGALIGEIQSLQVQASKVETLAEALETATTEVEGLRERNLHLEDREKARVLDEACAIGRIAPTERETYWKMIQTLGEEDTHRIMVEGRVPVSRTSTSAPADPTSAGSVEDAYLALIDKARSEGMSPQQAWEVARATGSSDLYLADREN